jgi:hypothetical protein
MFMMAAFLVPVSSCTVKSGKPVAPSTHVIDLDGRAADPFAGAARATVLLFVTTDCPISNAFVPEIHRLCEAYSKQGVHFCVVYADPALPPADAKKHFGEYGFRCAAVSDPKHELVERAGATITPEAAVFLPSGRLVYRGRINDLYIDYGKPRYVPTSHDLRDVLDAVAAGRDVQPRFTEAVGCHIPT